MPKMKLADWARKHGLSYLTANRHFHAGMIPNAQQLDSGTILVEDDSPEQTMAAASSDAMSFFLKKTVEFSKNNATVEDFAAFVISNFQLKLNSVSDGPKYSKQKPKPEEVQKHFQQFIPPKGEKPKPNSFVMDPEAFEGISTTNVVVTPVSAEELKKEFEQAVDYGSVVAPRNYATDVAPGLTPTAADTLFVGAAAAMSPTEGTVTRSVDLNTTPQPINYTGSNNLTFSGSFVSEAPTTATVNVSSLLNGSTLSTTMANNTAFCGIVSQDTLNSDGGLYLDHNPDFLELPNDRKRRLVEDKQPEEKVKTNQPHGKRGRKPSKR